MDPNSKMNYPENPGYPTNPGYPINPGYPAQPGYSTNPVYPPMPNTSGINQGIRPEDRLNAPEWFVWCCGFHVRSAALFYAYFSLACSILQCILNIATTNPQISLGGRIAIALLGLLIPFVVITLAIMGEKRNKAVLVMPWMILQWIGFVGTCIGSGIIFVMLAIFNIGLAIGILVVMVIVIFFQYHLTVLVHKFYRWMQLRESIIQPMYGNA